MDLVAHVFPDRRQLIEHIRLQFESGSVLRADLINRTYDDTGCRRHVCFVVSERNDVHDLLGMTFVDHKVHPGSFDGLSSEDMEYVRMMLRSRTRPAKETVNG